ncbi:MAG TPA: VOC family protein [Mycobacteriales bacterium]|nr:VOC family protein [Mycobacteriales bacterium]
MALGVQIVIDCADPAALAQFWAGALGYQLQPPPDGFDSWEDALKAWNVPESEFNSASAVIDPDGQGPRLYFQRVPEPKTVKNRLHMDLNVTTGSDPLEERKRSCAEAADRLGQLGATVRNEQEDFKGYCIVLQDPEGNEFCVH